MQNQSNPSQAEQNPAEQPSPSKHADEDENKERGKSAGLDLLRHDVQKHIEVSAPAFSKNNSHHSSESSHKSIKASQIKKTYTIKSISLRMILVYVALVFVTAILVIIF